MPLLLLQQILWTKDNKLVGKLKSGLELALSGHNIPMPQG